jgi:hypothetical protein
MLQFSDFLQSVFGQLDQYQHWVECFYTLFFSYPTYVALNRSLHQLSLPYRLSSVHVLTFTHYVLSVNLDTLCSHSSLNQSVTRLHYFSYHQTNAARRVLVAIYYSGAYVNTIHLLRQLQLSISSIFVFYFLHHPPTALSFCIEIHQRSTGPSQSSHSPKYSSSHTSYPRQQSVAMSASGRSYSPSTDTTDANAEVAESTTRLESHILNPRMASNLRSSIPYSASVTIDHSAPAGETAAESTTPPLSKPSSDEGKAASQTEDSGDGAALAVQAHVANQLTATAKRKRPPKDLESERTFIIVTVSHADVNI